MGYSDIATANKASFGKKRYPGRGMVIGLSSDSSKIFQIYWTMGRSENSRNRVFIQEKENIKNQLFRDDVDADTSLIIYYPMKSFNQVHIVSNGDQTETIFDYLTAGRTVVDALNSRTFEPDPPNFTPRITGIVYLNPDVRYELSIMKSIGNDERYRQFSSYSYDNPIPGFGHCLTTYVDDGVPLPSFAGEPLLLEINDDLKSNIESFWNQLDSDNRISICGKAIDTKSGKMEIALLNKNPSYQQSMP